MVTIILLIIIYLAFISLGLPDSLLGVTWPAMQIEWGMPLDAAGLIAMLTTGSTILSSFLSGHIINKFETGKVTFISCMMTGGALLGISFAPSYFWLLVLAIPLGLGAGSVDTALNNYVALHYKAHHMNWLHSFWGVGATLGPLIMAQTLLMTSSWRLGYQRIASFQLILAFILLLSLPLWTKHKTLFEKVKEADDSPPEEKSKEKHVYKIKGVKHALLTFLFYVAVELSIGLWGSSFLVEMKSLSIEVAASWIAMYYGGITLGRFISGFVSFRLTNIQMIRIGILIALFGSVLLLLPLPNFILMVAFVLIGLGLAPIFPAMIHETPTRFGKNHSQIIIGYQMGFGYIGSAILPPLFGVVVRNTSMVIFPFYIAACILIMLFCSERLTTLTKKVDL
ncbi:MFS transporter [Vallitalea okinawensis]|uniref:MFS transporter n=1 Tax=Vallitalea okinawensis TaxID=2078660 RepID=UPI000CFDAAD2|nr:MFS transporter [Vallitalea okinawensis]